MKKVTLRSEDEVVNVASQMKAKLLRRAANIEEMVSRMARSDAGSIRRLHPEVYDTIKKDLEVLKDLNVRDSVIYATVRWVLGLSEDIDYNDLQLSEE